jgi:hypothetical protein
MLIHMKKFPLALIFCLGFLQSLVAAEIETKQPFHAYYLIEPIYEKAGRFSDGLAAVYISGKWGFIDKAGKLTIEPQFNPGQKRFGAPEFRGGLAAVNLQKAESADSETLWGYIRQNGEFAILPRFKFPMSFASYFSEGLVVAPVAGKYGYFDAKGAEAIAPKFLLAYNFSQGLALARQGKGTGFIDSVGKFIISPVYEEVGSFSEDMARVTLNGKTGFIDKQGKIRIPLTYDWASDFSEGFAQVAIRRSNRKALASSANAIDTWEDMEYGYIDHKGVEAIPVRLPMSDLNSIEAHFSEGLAAFEVPATPRGRRGTFSPRGKFGFIDKTGKVSIAPKYDGVESFSEGLAAVKVGEKFGYIDRTGLLVIEAQFDEADSFKEGRAVVRIGGKYGFVRYQPSFVR